MSVADNFVFQFSTKGDKAAEKALQELLDVMKELKEEIVSVTKANDERQQKIKSQVSEERKATNLMFRERRFNRAEERKDRTARVREEGIRRRDAQRTLAYEHKATKEMWRMKDVKFRHEVNQRKEAQRLADREQRLAEKAYRKRLAQEKAEQKLIERRISLLKSIGRKMLSIAGFVSLPAMAMKGYSEEVDYARLAQFTGVEAEDIKSLGYALKSVGGNEEEAKKAIGGLTHQLALLRQGHPEVAEQLYGTISRGGMALTREEMQTPFGIIEGMNRAYQKLQTEDQKRLARDAIMQITGSMAVANLIASGKFSKEVEFGKTIDISTKDDEYIKKMQEDVAAIRNVVVEAPRALAGEVAKTWDADKQIVRRSSKGDFGWLADILNDVTRWIPFMPRIVDANAISVPSNNNSNVSFVYNNNAHNTGTADQINSIQRNDVLNYDYMRSRLNNLPTVGDNTMRSSQ